MHEPRDGPTFIAHELDEAIAIQRVIVECEGELAGTHPDARTRRLLRDMNGADARQLEELERLGRPYAATGRLDEVAGGLASLARTASLVTGEADTDTEAYEAHAVLLTLKRRQQDSAVAMLEIAEAMRLPTLRDGLERQLLEIRVTAAELSQALVVLAVRLATRPSGTAAPQRA